MAPAPKRDRLKSTELRFGLYPQILPDPNASRLLQCGLPAYKSAGTGNEFKNDVQLLYRCRRIYHHKAFPTRPLMGPGMWNRPARFDCRTRQVGVKRCM